MTRSARRVLVFLSVIGGAAVYIVFRLVAVSTPPPEHTVVQIAELPARRPATVPHLPVPTSAPEPTPRAGDPPTAAAPTCSVRGQLIDSTTNQALSGATLWLGAGASARPGDEGTSSASSDAAGTFALTGVPCARPVRIRVEREGYLTDVVDATVPAAGSVDAGPFRLVRGDWKKRFQGGARGMVGLEHELRNGRVVVTAVRPDGPAAASDIKPGERLVSVDGVSLDGLAHAARTYHLQGVPGSVARLLVEDANGRTRQVTITRKARPGAALLPVFY